MSVVTPRLSVVVPCFNEAANIPLFIERMTATCQAAAGGAYEIILVNDGSRDDTWACIRALAKTRPGVVALNLSRNHGHQLAVTAGLDRARGERVLIIDADLQDPPELLAAMMAKMDQGFDVVYGRRRVRASETVFKRTTAYYFYRILGRISDVAIPPDTGDFRLMTRMIVDRLNTMPEHDRFLRGMVAWLGGSQSELLYDRDPRNAGRTSYTLAKMVRLATVGLTSFSTVPLSLAACLTAFSMLGGGVLALYVFCGLMFGHIVPGWASLVLCMVFFSTAQLACLAVLSIYVGRIFMQVKQRPLFLVNDIVTSEARIGLGSPVVAFSEERQSA